MFRSQAEKAGKEFWSLGQNKASFVFFDLLILLLSTQLGKHFFPQFSFIYGLRIDYLSLTIYLTDILIFLIFLFSFKSILGILIRKYKRNVFLFLLFTLFLLVGVSVSKNPASGIVGIIKFLEFIYLGLFIYFSFEKLNKRVIVFLLGLGIVFESLLSLLQYLNQGSFQGVLYFLGERSFNQQTPAIANASINGVLVLRPYGTFSHPNVLGGFLVLSSIFVLSFKNLIGKYFLSIVLFSSTIGILVSFSRVAIINWLAFLLIYFVIMIVRKYKKPKINLKFLKNNSFALLTVLIIFFIILLNPIFLERFTLPSFSDESILQRISLINSSLEMFFKNPVFGVGINNFLNNLKTSFNTPVLIQPVHNIFLLTLAQVGVVGFFVFIYMFFRVVKLSIKSKDKKIIKLSIIFSIIFIGSFDHYLLTIQQAQILFTILITYCLLKE